MCFIKHNLVKIIIIFLVIILLNFRVFKVNGNSMYPTYKDNQYVLIKNIFLSKNPTYYMNKCVIVHIDILELNTLVIKRVSDIDIVNKKVKLCSDNTGDYLDDELGWIPIKNIRGVVL